MDLRKYSVSEFSEMLENEMKLNKEKCEKIAKYYEMKRDIKNDLEITYKIVAPVEKNVYYRRPLEMAYNYKVVGTIRKQRGWFIYWQQDILKHEVIGHKAYKKEKWKSSHFSFLFLQILNYKVFKIYHKKHQKARVNLKHLAGTIPSTAARWSARLPDHLPESSSFLIKRAAKSPAEKGKMKVPPKSPQRGTFFECP